MRLTSTGRFCGAVAVLGCLLGCPLSESTSNKVTDRAVAPGNLVCQAHELDVFLSWQNGQEYSQVQVLRDGAIIATLPGTAQSVSETLSQPGTLTYSVKGVTRKNYVSAGASCEVTVSAGSIANLACSFAPESGAVTLTWSFGEGSAFGGVRVSRGGSTLAELAGTATSYADISPPSGTIAYEVSGIGDGIATATSSCTVSVASPAGVRDFVGEIDQSTGDVLLSWQNGEAYDSLTVSIGGEPVATLDGNATSFRVAYRSCGVYDFEIRGTVGNRASGPSWWESQLGRLAWQPDTTGTVVGYHVYVWPEGDPVPALDAPALSIGETTTIALAQILAAQGLPENREPRTFNIALTAYDAQGTVSDLSTPVSFAWQVLRAAIQ